MADEAVQSQDAFSRNVATSNDLVEMAKVVAKEKLFSAASIDSMWMTAYLAIEQRAMKPGTRKRQHR